MAEITIPHDWQPLAHQKALWRYLEGGGKRAVAVWHRRAGKESTTLNWTAVSAIQKVGVYWHMLPTAAQARRVVWQAIDREGRRVIDQVFPEPLRKRIRNDEMEIELKNGSLWQLVGSDNYDRLVGSNPSGVVFSEYSLTDPRAWDYVRPILAENGGWAVFIFTPRGKNHAWELYEMARSNTDWFCESLSVEDTHAISPAAIEQERRSGMSNALIQQEFYASFEAENEGSYYGRLMEEAEREGRITRVPYDPAIPVHTFWDLGMADEMALWFVQLAGQEYHVIDYYENNGEALSHYVQLMQSKPYIYGQAHLPPDAKVRELGTGKSRLEVLTALGVKPVLVPGLSIADGIEAVRSLLPRCWFDREKCALGIRHLAAYHREFDEKRQVWRAQPVHDYSSHAADAFRYFAVHSSALRPRRAPSPVSRSGSWMAA